MGKCPSYPSIGCKIYEKQKLWSSIKNGRQGGGSHNISKTMDSSQGKNLGDYSETTVPNAQKDIINHIQCCKCTVISKINQLGWTRESLKVKRFKEVKLQESTLV